MDDFSPAYKAACDALRDRMIDCIRKNPKLIWRDIPDPAEFLSVAGFDVSDIDPSMAMMESAWESAQEVLRASAAMG